MNNDIPHITLRADLHAYVGPMIRSLANRIQFEVDQGIAERPAADHYTTPESMHKAADKIDDWREANNRPTSRSGTHKHQMGTAAPVAGDTLEIIHQVAKRMTEKEGGHFSLSDESPHSEASRKMVDLVADILNETRTVKSR